MLIEDTEPCELTKSEDVVEENYRSVVFNEISHCIKDIVEMYCPKSNSRQNLEEICTIGWNQIEVSPNELSNLFYYKIFSEKKYVAQREIDNFLWYCAVQYMRNYKEDINELIVKRKLTSDFFE